MTASATEPTSTDQRAERGPISERADSRADRFMLRLLRIPTHPNAKAARPEAAQSAFQTSIVLSAVRCLLTYIVLPFVAPFVGLAASIGEPLGILVALVAIVSITMSMRRFWRSRHKQRWTYTILGGVMMGFLFFLLATDISNL